MEFEKYQHIERFGTDEVEGIENGICYIFYKIDGTNGQVWLDSNGNIKAGSRNRELSLEKDNGGFYQYVLSDERIKNYLDKHPNHRLFGEWLIPHSLKTYRDDARKKFYVFDVCEGEGENLRYLSYDTYKPLLKEFGIEYIPPIAIISNPTEEVLIYQLEKTGTFLIKDGAGNGEGIVIKNYEYRNKYGRQTWAKIVCNEFKEKNVKEMGASTISCGETIEKSIVDKFCTATFIEKEYAKIVNENDGWTSKYIPMLLGRVFSEFIKEETWNILKEYKNPTINFKALNSMVILKIKETKKELF
jgi:hypothetical protein